jgi:hypothetical protein
MIDYDEYWKYVGPGGPIGPSGNFGSIENFSLTFNNSITVTDASLNSNMEITGTPLNLSLLDFDKNVFLDVSGILSKSVYDPSFATYDAIASLDVSLVHFRNMFAIESDSVTMTDLSNPSLFDNVHFIVYQDLIDSFIPNIGKNSIVRSGSNQLNDSLNVPVDQHVHNDFVRYVANLLFNTPYATELFINQEQLVKSTKKSLDYAWEMCKSSLQNVSTTSKNAYMFYDASGNYSYLNDALSSDYVSELYNQIVSNDPALLNAEMFYDVSENFYYVNDTLPVDSSGNDLSTTFINLYNQFILNNPELINTEIFCDESGNLYYLSDISVIDISGNGISNICGEIYKQIVSRDPERFINTNTLNVVNDSYNSLGGKQFYLPLIANDVITMRITLNPSSNQDTFGMTPITNPSAFITTSSGTILKPKIYLIHMRLV